MFNPCIPEEESRALINSMGSYPSFNASISEDNYIDHSDLSFSEIRNSMRIETEKQDKYIDILCDLFDESVQFNDSKKVMNA